MKENIQGTDFLFFERVMDKFQFRTAKELMGFSHGKKVYCVGSGAAYEPMFVARVDIHKIFHDIDKAHLYRPLTPHEAQLELSKIISCKGLSNQKLKDYIESVIQGECGRIGGKSPMGGAVLAAHDMISYRDAVCIELEKREKAEFSLICLLSGCTHYCEVDRDGSETICELTKPKPGKLGDYPSEENRIASRINLTMCDVNGENAFEIITMGECLASYISAQYITSDDMIENPIHYRMGSVLGVSEDVIGSRAGSMIAWFVRECGFSFKQYDFIEGFNNLEKALKLIHEIPALRDRFLAGKIEKYLSCDFKKLRNLQRRFENEYRLARIQGAHIQMSEAR